MDASGGSLSELPSELRGLVSFLSVDDRATVILNITQDGRLVERELIIKVVYSNPAFDRLSRHASTLEEVRNAVARSHSVGKDLSTLHNRILDGGAWQSRISGDYVIVISTARGTEPLQARQHALGSPLSRSGSDSTTTSSTSRSSTNSLGQPGLDWTKADRPGLSAWIQFIRNFDWASTPLGSMDTWSDVLRQYIFSIMANPDPRLIVWGDDMSFIYNEACVPMFGAKHPSCLGQNVKGVFGEAWVMIGPVIEAGYRGEVKRIHNFPLPIFRRGFLEETYWSFTTLPIIDEMGNGVGVIDELTESTAIVTSERRRITLNELSAQTSKASTLADLWPAALVPLEASELDIPFAILYTIVDDVPERSNKAESSSNGSSSTQVPKKAVLTGTVGVTKDHMEILETLHLDDADYGPGIAQACLDAWKTGEPVILSSTVGTLPSSLAVAVPGRGFSEPVRSVIISPVKAMSSSDPLAILIMGLNPRAVFGDEYQLFQQVVVNMIEKGAAVISLPEEQQRAQRIADDLNRALAQQLTTLRAEQKFSRLASTAPTGMFMFDMNGRPLYVNDRYLTMLGTTREEHMTVTEREGWKAIVHEDDLIKFSEAWVTATQQKLPITIEYRLKRSWSDTNLSGETLSGETWLLATAFPEVDSEGAVTSIQGWLTDISHRKFSEQLLAQRLEDALENKRQTENFIDMTSHEMRNPLSAILQSADSIETLLNSVGMPIIDEDMKLPTAVAEDIVDAAQTIILCAQHQKRIVDDILTLSKLDASLLVISPDKVDVPMLVTKALKMYEAEIERAGIDAELCIEPTMEELGVNAVILDGSRLLQVIINLLTNSIKFTQYSDIRKIRICIGASLREPTGKHHGISFIPPRQVRPCRTPRSEGASAEDVYLQFAVYDTGRGLNEDEMKLLFQRFQQASPKTYKQYGGSGLGLFISRELCELQGGQIGVASSKGNTVFTFYVRAKRWPEGEEPPHTRPPASRFQTSAASSPMMYNRRGSTMLETGGNQLGSPHEENGNMIENFHPSQHPVGQESVYQAASTKPVAHVPKTGTKDTDNSNGQELGLHVLIVEDNLINQKVMSQQLRRAGCTVHVANHGLECLKFLEKSTYCSSTTPLSVILLDLEMPTMDGLTCIRHIRERQTNGQITGHVPVIAVTANARSEQISSAIEAGMDQVVTKPFRIPELIPQLERLIAEVKEGK